MLFVHAFAVVVVMAHAAGDGLAKQGHYHGLRFNHYGAQWKVAIDAFDLGIGQGFGQSLVQIFMGIDAYSLVFAVI